MTYQVVGRRGDGSTVYYTGKAGKEFVSENIADAFQYESLAGARRRAQLNNRATQLHGVLFHVPNPDPEEKL